MINWVSPHSFLGVLGVIFNFYLIFSIKFLRVLQHHIWGYAVCLCPTNGMSGLYELSKPLEMRMSACPIASYEPHREKTGLLPMRKQRRRSASR